MEVPFLLLPAVKILSVTGEVLQMQLSISQHSHFFATAQIAQKVLQLRDFPLCSVNF